MNNSPSIDSTHPPVPRDHYPRTWALLVLVAAGVAAYHWQWARMHPPVVYTAPAVSAPDVRWFLVLRMPAISAQYESGIETMKTRYEEWLTTLSNDGFHFMSYSDMQARLSQGQGIPEKSILLVFDPGFRKTYEMVSPILARHQIPALWLSNGTAMKNGNREYVTYHTTRQMIDSGLWDVGFSDDRGGYEIHSRTHGVLQLGSADHNAWSSVTGGTALNRGRDHSELNRLNVISDWTPADLLTRVQTEVPIQRKMALTKNAVQNLVWGITVPPEQGDASAMNLKVLSYKRGLVLDWFGTSGIADFDLQASARALVGEYCMRLRWDEARGNGISVLVSNKEWVVIELSNFHVKNKWHHQRGSQSTAFTAGIHLQGNTLSVAVDGHPPVDMALSSATDADRGLFQLFLIDKFRGTARADGIQMTFTPL